MRIPFIPAAALAGGLFLAPAAAFAQAGTAASSAGSATSAPATTGSVESGRAVSGTGQTKPGGEPLDSRTGTTPGLEVKSREIDRKITTGICRGCQ